MDERHSGASPAPRSNRRRTSAAFPAPDTTTGAPDPEYRELTRVRDHTELMALIARALEALQFTDFAFTLKQTAENPAYYFSTSADANRFFHNLDDWEFDISAMYATRGNQPLFQSGIDAYLARAPFVTSPMAKSRALGTLARELGFEEMYHMPLIADGSADAVLTIGCRFLPRAQFHLRVTRAHSALERLCARIGAAIPGVFASGRLRAARSSLGHTSLLLLNALARDNLSLNAAADALCISVSAANKHVAIIKKNLQAKTIASAVYKAAGLGLID